MSWTQFSTAIVGGLFDGGLFATVVLKGLSFVGKSLSKGAANAAQLPFRNGGAELNRL